MIKVDEENTGWVEVVDGFFHRVLSSGGMMSMQKFKIMPNGVPGARHKHVNAQMVYVVGGSGLFWIEYDENGKEKEYKVEPGSSIYIPPNEYHNAVNRGDEPITGIDVFCPPRPDPTPSYMTKE